MNTQTGAPKFRQQELNQKIVRIFKRLQNETKLDAATWAKVLALSPRDLALVESETRSVPLLSLLAVGERFQLNLDQIAGERFDYPTAVAHFKGDFSWIPEKYRGGEAESAWLARHLLRYLTLNLGWPSTQRILRELQVHESVLTRAKARLNSRFMADLGKSIELAGFTRGDFFALGTFCADAMSESPENFRWGGTERNLPCFGSQAWCSFKDGFSSRLPRSAGMSPLALAGMRCTHTGPFCCRALVAESPQTRGFTLNHPMDPENHQRRQRAS